MLTLLLFTLPALVQKKFHLQLPTFLEMTLLIFIFAAEILGEIAAFYTLYPIWDDLLHATNGFIAAAIGFSLIRLLNQKPNHTPSFTPMSLMIIAFCFSMTVGVIWEFFEFGVDNIFNKDMQKDTVLAVINSVYLDPTNSNHVITVPIETLYVNGQNWVQDYGGYLDIGLYDTMIDLLVNALGALAFILVYQICSKSKNLSRLAKSFFILKDTHQNITPNEENNN